LVKQLRRRKPVKAIPVPIWTAGQRKRSKEEKIEAKQKRNRPYMVLYDLAYDGGGDQFVKYYRTQISAKVDAFFQQRFPLSWGGSAVLYKNPDFK